MDLFVGLPDAVQLLLSGGVLLYFALGVINGMIFGALPGLSGSVGIALMIPLTFRLDAGQSMTLFVAALSGQTFAGSITAILLNTPGTSPNAATTFDGYPLTQQGRGGFALGISATASALGSLIGAVVLILLIPVVRSVILSVSFPEYTMLIVMGLAAIALASRGSMIKGLVSGSVGLSLSFVGFSPMGGELRYVFGQQALVGGIGVIAVLIGLFAVSEVIRLLVDNEAIAEQASEIKFGFGQVFEGVVYTVKQPWLLIRSSVLGTALGIIPAVGGTVAAFMAYFQASQTSRDGTFGHGDPRGVLAPEAANDAKDAGAALPSLAFGLPGSADWAIILGAMILHGVNPGPNLIRENPDIIWIAIIVIIAASLVTSIIGLALAPRLIHLSAIRPSLLAPVVGVLAVIGAYALNRQFLDVLVAVALGITGYYMKRFGVPLVPLILGLLLGGSLERNLFQSFGVLGEGVSVFFTRPISLVLVLITLAIIASSIRQAHRAKDASGAHPPSFAPGDVALMAVFFLLSLGMFVGSFGFIQPESRNFPLAVSAVGLLLTGTYLVVILNPRWRARFPWVVGQDVSSPSAPSAPSGRSEVTDAASATIDSASEPASPEPAEKPGSLDAAATAASPGATPDTGVSTTAEPWPREPRAREAALVAVFAAFVLAIWTVGVLPSAAAFIVAVMWVLSREKLWMAGLFAVMTTGFVYVLFVTVLQVSLPTGRLL